MSVPARPSLTGLAARGEAPAAAPRRPRGWARGAVAAALLIAAGSPGPAHAQAAPAGPSDCACVRNDTGQAVVYEVGRGGVAPQTITSEPRVTWWHCIGLREGQPVPPLFVRLDTDPGAGVATHRFRVLGAATPVRDCKSVPEEGQYVLVRTGSPERVDLQRRPATGAVPEADRDAAAWTRLAHRLGDEGAHPERHADDALRLCRHGLARQNEEARRLRAQRPPSATPVEVEQVRLYLLEAYLRVLDQVCRGQPEHERRAEFDERLQASRRACGAIARGEDACRPRLAW